MKNEAETRKLLHDIQSKCASLKSAAKVLKDCPPEEARDMLALMARGAREVVEAVDRLRENY